MNRVFVFALVFAACATAALRAPAQAPANSGAGQGQTASPATPPKPTQEANPFPEDTNSVPVMPSADSPGSAEPAPAPDSADYGNVPLPGDMDDPVRSPDSPEPAANGAEDSGSSSSNAGLDNLLKPPPDTGKPGKHKADAADATPHEGPKEDVSVGSYYLDQKNWKGALSRFESALVLDPENPDVYWGLGEAQRHMGDFASAKANYLKLIEYDPDSKHAREAKRILKEPEMAGAPAVSSNASTPKPRQ